ncbi:hypothetical protein [Neorhizobium sp. NCHU2750]|uniref:hypothetical protein n=1 Tax=Neorhizobium sp. NCHU2750 TaxID=1825976 RepID=UPI000EB6DFE8|nr:hypothetical protein NCHU2750_38670 [Neorhizobium sp. NCHU2750]
MLPPVQAALSSNIDFQSQSQVAATRPRVDVASGTQQSDPEKASAISSARSDAMSLSAQLKLAQGSSVFAETIGKLLKTPRQDGETLADYTSRLFNAVQVLKPAEVANIERLLNQIVQGISLRILAEVLREPTGAAAARLAVYIEMASSAEQDPAANAVVSSYQQNDGSEPPPAANDSRPPVNGSAAGATATGGGPNQAGGAPTGTGTAVIAGSPAIADGGAATDTPDGIASAIGSDNAEADAAGAGRTAGAQQQPAATGADRPAMSAKAGDGSTNQPATASASAPAPSASPAEKPAVAGQMADAKPSGPAMPGPAQADAHPSPSQPTMPAAAASQAEASHVPIPVLTSAVAATDAAYLRQAAADGDGTELKDALKLQEAALLLQAYGDDGDDMPVPARLWTSLSDQAVAKLATWAAAIADNMDVPSPAAIAAASGQQAVAGEAIDQQQTAGIPITREATSSPAQQLAANSAVTDDAADDVRMANSSAAPRNVSEQSLAAASATLQAPLRESPPWPYVAAYPPGEEEPKRRERKTPPVSAIEDEEQDSSAQQEAFQGESDDSGAEEQAQEDAAEEEIVRDRMTAAEKAAGYTAAEASIGKDPAEASAGDLYWRMAGWTDSRGEDTGSRQHLADMKKAAEPLGPAAFKRSGNDDYSLLPRFFRAAPRMSPSEAPESDEPN